MTLELTRRAALGAMAALLCVRPKVDEAPAPRPSRMRVEQFAVQSWTLSVFDEPLDVLPGDLVRYIGDQQVWRVLVTRPGTVRGMWLPSTPHADPFLDYCFEGGDSWI